jgi:PAS domain S-box-containing protein
MVSAHRAGALVAPAALARTWLPARRWLGPVGMAWALHIVLWLACLALLGSHRQGLLAHATREASTVARLVDQNVATLLDKSGMAVAATATQLERQLATGGIDRSRLWWLVDAQAALVPQVIRIGVFDADGRQVCGNGTGRCLGTLVADRDFFQHHRTGHGSAVAVHGPHDNRVDGQPALLLSRALRLPDGSFAGVVVAVLPLAQLQALLAGIDLGPNGAASVRGAGMALLARQPALPVLTSHRESRAVSAGLQAALSASAPSGTIGTLAANDGIHRLTAYRRMAAYPLVVLVGVAVEDTLSGWYPLAGATALLLLLAAGASVAGVRLAGRNARRGAHAQALYDEAPCGCHQLDADGVIVDINNTELAWLGLPREAVVGRMTIGQFLTDAGRATFAERFPALVQGQAIDDLALDLVSATGQTRRVLVSARPVLDAQGRFLMSNSVLQDITALQQAEERRLEVALLAAQNAQLETENRFKNALLSNLSHEMRTPLIAVIGFSGLLQSGSVPPGSPKGQVYLGRIQQGGRQLLDLVDTMLDLARWQARQITLQPRPLDHPALLALLHQVLALHQPAIDARQLQASVFVDDSMDALQVDPQRLRQLLAALVDNAIKFSHPGGRVSLLALPDGPQHWRLDVQDDGIGIAEPDLPRLFQTFGQLDAGTTRAHGGLGLGLALAQRLAHAMGGSLSVESRTGQGSMFRLRLPCQQGDS